MAADEETQRPPWMPPLDPPEGEPLWDQSEADSLVGQYLLGGLTYLASDGETVTSQVQFHGRIAKADKKGVSVVCEGQTWRGQTATLPPDLRAFSAAGSGEYKLRTTGEIVNNPDLLTTWTIKEPSKPS